VFSTEPLYKILTLSANYEQSYVGVAALSWQFFRLGEHIRLEVEVKSRSTSENSTTGS
jgi:hypothetical protein